MILRAPFQWFGGKSKAAKLVWSGLGDVDNYIEPFFGSGAVLLGRPKGHSKRQTETVNDIDQFIANFWRAVTHDAPSVAYYADYPINEADLFARHLWLIQTGKPQMLEKMTIDPEWYDAKIAGWWLWGLSQWIGSGWCHGNGPWEIIDGKLFYNARGGKGVNRQLIQLGNGGVGINSARVQDVELYSYMELLAQRLRNVRVACGDWTRVLTKAVIDYGAVTGVFLDPPYTDKNERDMGVYANDSAEIAHEVREWALEHENYPGLRIVMAGYEGEHDMPATWRKVAWTGNAAFSSSAGGGNNSENRTRERLWFSPSCLIEKPTLFDMER